MKPETEEAMDIASVTTVAIVAIIAVVLIVTNLGPSVEAAETESKITGNAMRSVTYDTARRRVTTQFDTTLLDFNQDGRVDFYDYQDILAGKSACNGCDLNADSLIDGKDQEAFNLLVRRVYDYDNNGKLTREDSRLLAQFMMGSSAFDENYIYDLDGNGHLDKEDITLYTSLLYNYENPEVKA